MMGEKEKTERRKLKSNSPLCHCGRTAKDWQYYATVVLLYSADYKPEIYESSVVTDSIIVITNAMTTPKEVTTVADGEVEVEVDRSDIKKEMLATFKKEQLEKVEELQEQAHLIIFKKELMEKVDEHLQEYHRMEEEQAQLAVFKNELLEKVDEHLKDIHRSQDKAYTVTKFKDELMKMLDHHQRSVELRASF